MFQWLLEFQNFDGVSKFQEFRSFMACLEILASFKVSKFQEFQEFQWLWAFQNFNGVSEFQSFKACLEIFGKFQSFEVSRVSGVSMAFGGSKF